MKWKLKRAERIERARLALVAFLSGLLAALLLSLTLRLGLWRGAELSVGWDGLTQWMCDEWGWLCGPDDLICQGPDGPRLRLSLDEEGEHESEFVG